MDRLLNVVRFFQVVPPVPRLMVAAFVLVAAAAAVALAVEPSRAARVVVPIVVLQVFAVSTGFAASARRGYYDVLLTGGAGRLRIALVHWAMSVAPGAASWVALGIVEAAVAGDVNGVMASGTAAAMFVVSTVPWAVTVALPRFTGAIGWTLLCVMAVSLTPIGDPGDAAWRASAQDGPWIAASEFLLFPTRLMAEDAGHRLAAVTPAIAFATLSMVVALTWIRAYRFPP